MKIQASLCFPTNMNWCETNSTMNRKIRNHRETTSGWTIQSDNPEAWNCRNNFNHWFTDRNRKRWKLIERPPGNSQTEKPTKNRIHFSGRVGQLDFFLRWRLMTLFKSALLRCFTQHTNGSYLKTSHLNIFWSPSNSQFEESTVTVFAPKKTSGLWTSPCSRHPLKKDRKGRGIFCPKNTHGGTSLNVLESRVLIFLGQDDTWMYRPIEFLQLG